MPGAAVTVNHGHEGFRACADPPPRGPPPSITRPYGPLVPMLQINGPRLKLPEVARAVAPLKTQDENGPRGALASHVEAGTPFNLFVPRLSEPDSSALPGMFLIVVLSHEGIYNHSMTADRINQRSIQSLFTENFFFSFRERAEVEPSV